MSVSKAVFVIALFLTGIFLGMNLAPVTGMPIQSVTPEQAAAIFVQPLKDEMNGLKADLVSGEIDNEEYLNLMGLLKLKVEMKLLLLLEAVRDSDQPWDKKMELLFGILPWNVRSADGGTCVTYGKEADGFIGYKLCGEGKKGLNAVNVK